MEILVQSREDLNTISPLVSCWGEDYFTCTCDCNCYGNMGTCVVVFQCPIDK